MQPTEFYSNKLIVKTYIMKNLFIIALLLSSRLVKAQDEKSIQFQHGVSWSQIKEKARNENKYIFMDAFTTWCLPCRVMANKIFPQPNVADFFNKNFINVAVQFDVTKNDNEEVKSWYKDAKSLIDTFKINSYPTYLFFSPDGELVHKILGASATGEDFIAKSKKALNPDTQYYTLKRQYEAGKKDPQFLLLLINAAQLETDSKFIPVVINEYLAAQKDLLTEANVKLLLISTSKSTHPGFTALRNHASLVDSIAGKGKSKEVIRNIAFDEIVLPQLRSNGAKTDYGGGMVVYSGEVNERVDWTAMKEKLDVQYPDISEEIIMASKPVYYEWKKDWLKFSGAVSAYLSAYENQINNDQINAYARTVLANCEDLKCIDSALAWSKKTLTGEDAEKIKYVYTHANLTYKLGKKEHAIKFLEDAVERSAEADKDLTALLDKMKKGEKTW